MKTIKLLLISIFVFVFHASEGYSGWQNQDAYKKYLSEKPKVIVNNTLILTNSASTNKPLKETLYEKIEKDLEDTYHSQDGTTKKYAKKNHKGDAINCIQYCYRIKDLAQKEQYKTEIWLVEGERNGNHAIIIIIDKKTKERICYSNGRVKDEEDYTKKKKLE